MASSRHSISHAVAPRWSSLVSRDCDDDEDDDHHHHGQDDEEVDDHDKDEVPQPVCLLLQSPIESLHLDDDDKLMSDFKPSHHVGQ